MTKKIFNKIIPISAVLFILIALFSLAEPVCAYEPNSSRYASFPERKTEAWPPPFGKNNGQSQQIDGLDQENRFNRLTENFGQGESRVLQENTKCPACKNGKIGPGGICDTCGYNSNVLAGALITAEVFVGNGFWVLFSLGLIYLIINQFRRRRHSLNYENGM
jgi:hypothetical protein